MSEVKRIQDSEGNDLNKTPTANGFDKLLDEAEAKAAAAQGDQNPNEEQPKAPEPEPEKLPKELESSEDTDKPSVEDTDKPVSDTSSKSPSPEDLIDEANSLSEVKLDDVEVVIEPETPAISEELTAQLDEIDQNPHTEAAVKNTIANLRNRLSEVSSEAKKVNSLQKQLEELQNQPSGVDLGITKENLEGMQEELLMFRRRFQLESDPTFTKELDDDINANEQQLETLLIRYGMAATDADKNNPTDVSVEDLKRKGGLVKVFESSPAYFKQVKAIIADVNDLDAEDFSGTIKNIRQLRKKKEVKLTEESGKAKEFFGKVDEDRAELAKQQDVRNQELVKYRTDLSADLTKKFKFLQERQVSGTDDQKAAATLHNERLIAHKEKLGRIVNAEGLGDYADIAELAMMTGALTNSLSDALTEVKDLRAKNKKISGSSRIKEVNKPPVVESKEGFKATANFDDALNHVENKHSTSA